MCEEEQPTEDSTVPPPLGCSAHVHGNYHKYYTFHPAEQRSSFFEGKDLFLRIWRMQGQPPRLLILDVGCNEGNLSVQMLEQAESELSPHNVECKVLGVDLDPSLIDLARSKYPPSSSAGNRITFKALDFMNEHATMALLREFFQMIDPTEESNSAEGRGSVSRFNVVCLYSITMWIHLNHGDEGLKQFLRRAKLCALEGVGCCIIEPQPWKCYKNADRRCRKLGLPRPPHFGTILIRENIEDQLIQLFTSNATGVGYNHHEVLGTEGWGRSLIMFYQKQFFPPEPQSSGCDESKTRSRRLVVSTDSDTVENSKRSKYS